MSRSGVTHPRVVNAKDRGATFDIYAGRGPCPRCRNYICRHMPIVSLGNPFPLDVFGPEKCMAKFFDHVAVCMRDPNFRDYVPTLADKDLACWCKGRYPVCHAEVWARLADGEVLDAIRDDVLSRIATPDVAGKAQRQLFGGES